jgi:hypothetical protein
MRKLKIGSTAQLLRFAMQYSSQDAAGDLEN